MNRETRKTGGKTEEKGRHSDEVEEIVDGLTLFDDDLMSRVFDKNIAASGNIELRARAKFNHTIEFPLFQMVTQILPGHHPPS